MKANKPQIVHRPWKVENGTMPQAGVIHISDINPTLKMLETYLEIDLIHNTIGSAGKRVFSGDIDIAIDSRHNNMDTLFDKLKTIPCVTECKKTSIIMNTVEIPNYDSLKYKDVNGTGFVQVDFMFNNDINFLKFYYHSPSENDSNYKGLYRNILLGAIAHYYDVRYSNVNIIDDIPTYEERYFWSPDLGLYRGRKYKILSVDKTRILKKTINSIMGGNEQHQYKDAISVANILNLSGPHSLYSFETLYNDINTRYDNTLVCNILKEFLNNPTIQKYGIPTELSNQTRNDIIWN